MFQVDSRVDSIRSAVINQVWPKYCDAAARKYSGLIDRWVSHTAGWEVYLSRCIFVSRSAGSDSMIGMNLLNLPIKFTELKLASSEGIR